jgi:hypothetical protein
MPQYDTVTVAIAGSRVFKDIDQQVYTVLAETPRNYLCAEINNKHETFVRKYFLDTVIIGENEAEVRELASYLFYAYMVDYEISDFNGDEGHADVRITGPYQEVKRLVTDEPYFVETESLINDIHIVQGTL